MSNQDHNAELTPSQDFIIEGNHARMSQKKVAEITKVNQSTVSRYLCDKVGVDGSKQDGYYIAGNALHDLVCYLALDAKKISDEVRQHNIKLLADSSKVGFQALIDKMAGIHPELGDDEPVKLSVFDEFKAFFLEQVAPDLNEYRALNQACREHKGAGYVVNSSAQSTEYPSETLTTAQYCKKHGLDRSLWLTFSKRYAQFVRVGTGQNPPKRGGKLLIYGELYYYAECAIKSVMDIE